MRVESEVEIFHSENRDKILDIRVQMIRGYTGDTENVYPDGEAHVEQSANIVTQEIDNRD